MQASDVSHELECLRLFGIDAEDETPLREVRACLEPAAVGIVNEFYEHLENIDEARPFFAGEERLMRLRQTQTEHLLSLGDFRKGDPASVLRYFERRRRVGLTHFRVGLPQELYLGAYSVLGDLALRTVAKVCRPECVSALHKVLLLDAHLAIEAYSRESGHALREAATYDELCKTLTRRATLDRLKSEFSRAKRFSHEFSLVFIDIDHFKRVNDTYGHLAGDSVLRAVSETLLASVRPCDIVGRYAGDEFIIGIVEAGAARALAIAHRIREAIERLVLPGIDTSVSVSMGIAELAPLTDLTLETLIARSDSAMYAAKREGSSHRIVVR
ncbi:MAG: diguanylate cyclase [Polyangiaceae bacterium]